MKIMVYSSAATFGGHELVALKGLEALLDAGHSLDIVCSRSNQAFVRVAQEFGTRYPNQCQVHVRKYHMKSLQIVRAWTCPLLAIQLCGLIKSLRPDRVLALQGDIEQASEIALPAWIARVPAVTYIPMVMSGRERSIGLARFRDVLSRPIYKLFYRFIVIADYFKEQALQRGAREVRVVVNCIDDAFHTQPVRRKAMRDRLGIREGEFLSGFVGRISYQQKGIDRLVDLVARDPNHFRLHRLLIVGSGPDMPRLVEDLHKRGIADCVLLRPWDDDRVAYFDAMDVFLCASRFEGVPLTIIEALSRGVSVISTPLPALVGRIPLTFVEQEFKADTILTLLQERSLRKVAEECLPVPLLAGHQRTQFNTAFVQAVAS
jgi:glycosyltransferase involved in cell wall biosynthesis